MNVIQPFEWIGDATTGRLRLLDQTVLPGAIEHIDCVEVDEVWHAIKRMSVRGAPAIGIATAYGVVLGARADDPYVGARQAIDYLATSRSKAENLNWALERQRGLVEKHDDPSTLASALLNEAKKLHAEDQAACRSIGEHALSLLIDLTKNSLNLLTHGNAGALATGGIGTATAPMYLAHEREMTLKVFADETHPIVQGSRLTAWELQHVGIDVTVISDSMVADVMRNRSVNAIIMGADRIAANGDVANSVGTYRLAVLAQQHDLPFVVAAPSSSIDLDKSSGADIPIEDRGADELTAGFGRVTAPDQIPTHSPALDITPADLITAIVTERGVIRPITADRIRGR